MSNLLTVELNKAIRFLALEWREPWEFDHPSVLLEPVFNYSPNHNDCESMIEDAAIDICLDVENSKPIRVDPHPSDLKEFEWRGWSVSELRVKAEKVLHGEDVDLSNGYIAVLEKWIVFFEDSAGEIWFNETESQNKTGRSLHKDEEWLSEDVEAEA